LAFAPVVFLVFVGASASRAAAPISLAEPLIVHAQAASDLEKLAARELLRHLYRGAGKVGAVAADTAVPADPGRTRIHLDVAAAKQKARAAWDAVAASGLREALQTYPRKMSTMSEFGSLARIQVKG
jgi:hypothetical protein